MALNDWPSVETKQVASAGFGEVGVTANRAWKPDKQRALDVALKRNKIGISRLGRRKWQSTTRRGESAGTPYVYHFLVARRVACVGSGTTDCFFSYIQFEPQQARYFL